MPKEALLITQNRRARHDFLLKEELVCGIALTGTEIKSIRAREVSIKEAYVVIKNGELWLMKMHIAPYQAGSIFNHDPLRPRKLLARRREIRKLAAATAQEGLTLVPLAVVIDHGLAKVVIAVAQGKKKYDKRAAAKEKAQAAKAREALRR